MILRFVIFKENSDDAVDSAVMIIMYSFVVVNEATYLLCVTITVMSLPKTYAYIVMTATAKPHAHLSATANIMPRKAILLLSSSSETGALNEDYEFFINSSLNSPIFICL